MRSVDNSFYRSKAWRMCRSEYLRVNPLCEECLKRGQFTPAILVHHKIFLNEKNINDPNISLNFKNLEALCLDCHNKIHFGENKRRYIVDELGNIKGIDSPPV